ncbi:MAG: TonB-dependent receptor [Terracidiphilus sp.]
MNKMLRTAFVLAAFACANLLLLTPVRAQSVYGSIFGTVTDSTGAAVPGATVNVTDEAKGTVVTAISNATGDYTVPHLIPDVYDLKVTAKGFKTFEAKGVPVEADAAPRIDPTLEIGGAETTVEVNADTQPELKTDRADVSTVFDQQQVSSLPIGDQNFTNLQLLLPGAQLLGWSHAADENPQGSKQIQVDGQAFGGTAFELDGTDNQDPILGIIVINPPTDSVTETKISTQNYDAELGKAVSAVMTAQTKSGTNTFHGDIYDWRTGNANYARDPYSEPVGSIPAGLKSRFGGSIGGPVIKDKFFFFANYEAQRQKVGTAATDTLPTSLLTETALGNVVGPSGIPGADFSEYLGLGDAGIIYDNLDAPNQSKTSPPNAYPHNVIPRAQLGPASAPALALLKYLEPFTKGLGVGTGKNSDGLDENYNATGTGLFNSNLWDERVDYTINEKMHAFERFSRFWDLLSGTVMFGTAGGPGFGINNYGGNSNGANDSEASGMDIAISPKLLTDFRLGYYRYNIIDVKHDQTADFADTLGIPNINMGTTFTGGSPGFNVTNLPGGGGGTNGTVYGDGLGINRCNCPLTEREDQFQIVNNWTKIVGNHSIKVGADLRYGRNLRVPSDSDRDGQLNFTPNPTEDQFATTQGGLGFATFMLGEVGNMNRYVSVSTNAKEFQKRTFFYGQDTWRATHNLTLNLGLRWELYFPEAVNGPGNGSLMNLTDGYMHVAGIGGIPSDMGWDIDKAKQFAPRIGASYQLDPKTVIRAGYGRSFDTGVFGSTFGHVVTQNLPVLANQALSSSTTVGYAFPLAGASSLPGAGPGGGPIPYKFPTVPSNGLLPAQGYNSNPKARHDPLHFPTIDAWNLSAQRALTPTMSLTVAYVANKGTHTLADGDGNNTNPNESFVALPGQYSVTGQTLTYDPAHGQAGGSTPLPSGYSGGVSNAKYLQRYYGGSLAGCKDPNYISIAGLRSVNGGDVNLQPGMCGWNANGGIAYYGDDENTEFDAMQITLAQTFQKGLAVTGNYQWASAFDDTSNLWTWSHVLTHLRDSNVRNQQFTGYGSYDLPFGKGKQYASGVNHATDLLIGGFQLSSVVNWSGGLPYSTSYNECGSNVPNSPNPTTSGGCVPNASGRMPIHLTGFTPNPATGTGTRCYYNCNGVAQPTLATPGVFSNPGLDHYGDAGLNAYRGPRFFSTDMAVTKAFSIWESVTTQFRMDAFNAFNHITAANPGGNIESVGSIGSEGGGCGPGNDCGPRQLEFSLRLQF